MLAALCEAGLVDENRRGTCSFAVPLAAGRGAKRSKRLAPRQIDQSELACTGGDHLGCTIVLDWLTRDRDADPAEVAAVVGRMCAAGDGHRFPN